MTLLWILGCQDYDEKKYQAGSDTKVIELELDRIADYFGSAPDPSRPWKVRVDRDEKCTQDVIVVQKNPNTLQLHGWLTHNLF